MNDYEFVKSIYDKGGCEGLNGKDCAMCPIRDGSCAYYAEICARAKAWLESHKKENEMDGIKVTVEEKKVEEKAKYPCYKIGLNGLIVLFESPGIGTLIVNGIPGDVRKSIHSNWEEKYFHPFHGTIKIEVE